LFLSLLIFFIAALITGLNADTSRLNKDVAVKVAVTLTIDVTAAAETISALGTGISMSKPGTVIVVASASCGRLRCSGSKEGCCSGVWYNGTCAAGTDTFMGGTTAAGGFFS